MSRSARLRVNSDRPVDVAAEDGGAVELDPELAHVEVVDGRDTAERIR